MQWCTHESNKTNGWMTYWIHSHCGGAGSLWVSQSVNWLSGLGCQLVLWSLLSWASSHQEASTLPCQTAMSDCQAGLTSFPKCQVSLSASATMEMWHLVDQADNQSYLLISSNSWKKWEKKNNFVTRLVNILWLTNGVTGFMRNKGGRTVCPDLSGWIHRKSLAEVTSCIMHINFCTGCNNTENKWYIIMVCK